MSYFIRAFKREGKHVYRVWCDDEFEYGPEMSEIEIMDWAKELVGVGIEGRLELAREKGRTGMFGVGVIDG